MPKFSVFLMVQGVTMQGIELMWSKTEMSVYGR